jgi:uncharacterized protein YvpB
MASFLSEAAKWYKQEPHQKAAWDALESKLDSDTLEAFKAAYRAAQRPQKSNPLSVPYFQQLDNTSGQGYRECFSSSCAMLAAFYGKVKTDDEYNLIRKRFGDTTNLGAQVEALKSLGLKPEFRTNGRLADLLESIDDGHPVAVGWLHKGHVSNPSGGGHWSVVIGYDNKTQQLIHHDPFGEAALVGGDYVNHTRGKAIRYSYKNWVPRWEVDGPRTGWLLTCR